mmetsp:Transcript_22244/g.48641  ORF Transcript_22244/g.48641 Transcript_22244/m.48641 type:complete len:140 (+) Transcript_22244:542-961(+)
MLISITTKHTTSNPSTLLTNSTTTNNNSSPDPPRHTSNSSIITRATAPLSKQWAHAHHPPARVTRFPATAANNQASQQGGSPAGVPNNAGQQGGVQAGAANSASQGVSFPPLPAVCRQSLPHPCLCKDLGPYGHRPLLG